MARVLLHVGDKVTHTKLGEGVVTVADEEYATIKFATDELTFRLPDAFFKGFLRSEAINKKDGESNGLQDSLHSISVDLEKAKTTLEQVRDDEDDEEYLETIENAIDALDEAMEYLEEAMEHIEEAEEEEHDLLNS